MATIDLTKPKSAKPTFGVPPAASPIPNPVGQMPLPVGKTVRIKSPSPGERAVLELHGWKDGDPVPENLGELITESYRSATDLENMPPPGDLSTPPLVLPDEQNIEDLSPEQQVHYRDVVQQALAMARAEEQQRVDIQSSLLPDAGQGINEAIRMAASDMPKLVDDRAKPNAEPKPEETKPVAERCTHCGWPTAKPDDIEVTENDKLLFLQAIIGLKPFQKTYPLMGGKLVIGVRGLQPDETDMTYRQCFLNMRLQRSQTWEDQADWLAKYRCALQLTSIHGLIDVRFPQSIEAWELPANITAELTKENDTKLHGIWLYLKKEVLTTDTLYRLIGGTVGRFNDLVLKLEANQNNPDFWSATGSAD